MKKGIVFGFALVGLAACTDPVVPDSGAGVGFTDYAQYELERAQREAALTGAGAGSESGTAAASAPFGAPAPVTTAPLSAIPAQQQVGGQAGAQSGVQNGATAGADGIGSDELARAGIGQSQGASDALLTATQAEQRRIANLANNPGISDENDFSAVSDRETIESDAQRRAAQAAELVVVDAVPLPATRAATGANIVAYALNAPNVKGQEWYSRSILSGDNRFQRNCATYNNPDEAQRDFLSRGGPDRDPRGIDPDGDGFACGWDPAPFKLAAQG